MLQAGLCEYRSKVQLRVKMEDAEASSSGTSPDPSGVMTARTEVYWDTLLGPALGFKLEIQSLGHDGPTHSTTWTVDSAFFLTPWTDTQAVTVTDSEIIVELREVRLYVSRGGYWYLFVGELEVFVDGSSVYTDSGLSINSDIKAPVKSAIPIFGRLPDINAAVLPYAVSTYAAPPMILPDPWSASASMRAVGGWRWEDSIGWQTGPVIFDPLDLPVLSCVCPAPGDDGDPTAEDTWSVTVPATARGGITIQEVEEPYDCAPCDGAGVLRYAIYSSESEGVGGTVSAVPNWARSIVRLNDDFEALWFRWALPDLERTSYRECGVTIDNGTTVTTTASDSDEVIPVLSQFLERVYDDEVSLATEGLTYTIPTLHDFSGYAAKNSFITPLPSDPCIQVIGEECPDPPVAPWEVRACASEARQAMLGAGGSPAGDIPGYDVGDSRSRYINYILHGHDSLSNWFEELDLNGVPTPWKDYSSPIGQQWIDNPGLPSGERTKRRNDLVTDVLEDGILSARLDGLADPLRFIGVTRHEITEPTIPASYTYDAGSEDLWELDNCTATFGGGGITLDPSSAGTITAALKLASYDYAPWLHAQICRWITVAWSTTNVTDLRVYLENTEGERVEVNATSGVEFARPYPTIREEAYAGSWAIENGNGAIADTGTDIQVEGISAPTMADPIRSAGYQLLSGYGAAKLVIEIDPTSQFSNCDIDYPVIRATDEWVGRYESRQIAALVSEHGPKIRLGNRNFWDGAAQDIPPTVEGKGYRMSLLDLGSDLRTIFEARAADDDITGFVSAFLDSTEDDGLEAASECQAFHLSGLKFAMVNPLREVGPIALFPRRLRDADYAETGDYAMATYTIAQRPRKILHPRVPARLQDPSNVLLSLPADDPVLGWKEQWFDGPVDNQEVLDWKVVIRGRELGNVRPWHGWTVVSYAIPATALWNMHLPWGPYIEVSQDEDGVLVSRADVTISPFAEETIVWDDPNVSEVRIQYSPAGAVIYAVWTYNDSGNDVHWGAIYDDGRSVEDLGILFADASRGDLAEGSLNGWLVSSARDDATGVLRVRQWAPGETTWGTEFNAKDELGADLILADDNYHFRFAHDGAQIMVLVGKLDGENDVKNWYSSDFGETWTANS